MSRKYRVGSDVDYVVDCNADYIADYIAHIVLVIVLKRLALVIA